MYGGEDFFKERRVDEAHAGGASGCGFSRKDEEEGRLIWGIQIRQTWRRKFEAKWRDQQQERKSNCFDPGGLCGMCYGHLMLRNKGEKKRI